NTSSLKMQRNSEIKNGDPKTPVTSQSKANDGDEEKWDSWDKLTPDQLIRGQTPVDIEKRCLDLCQTYIGGSWSKVNDPSEITVKRIYGGFTNQLYRVSLKASALRVRNEIYTDEPSEVAIKFYQEKHFQV